MASLPQYSLAIAFREAITHIYKRRLSPNKKTKVTTSAQENPPLKKAGLYSANLGREMGSYKTQKKNTAV